MSPNPEQEQRSGEVGGLRRSQASLHLRSAYNREAREEQVGVLLCLRSVPEGTGLLALSVSND